MRIADFSHLNLSLHDDGRLLLLELRHGKANEMGRAQLAELERLAERLEGPDAPRAMITFSERTSSKGTPIFVSGADVTERRTWELEDVKAHVRWQRRVLHSLRHAPVFHVIAVDGIALGWGTEFMLTGDWRIAGDRAEFGLPETGLGIVPGAGGTSELWADIGVAHALRLGMTGERVSADEALRIGLVQERAADLPAAMERARALCAAVYRRSPTAVAAFKRAVLASVGQPAERRTEEEARAYEHCVDLGEATRGREAFEAIRDGRDVAWGPQVPWRPLG